MASIRVILWVVNVMLLGTFAYATAVTGSGLLEEYLVRETPAVTLTRLNLADRETRKRMAIGAFAPVLEVNMFEAARSEVKRPGGGDDGGPDGATGPITVSTGRPAVSVGIGVRNRRGGGSAGEEDEEGAAGEGPRAAGEGKASAPEKLPIKLLVTGTLVMGNHSAAFVVGQDGRTESVYLLNECLPKVGDVPTTECNPRQASLALVERDQITLAMLGRNYIVKLGEETEGEAVSARPKPARTDTRRRRVVRAPSRAEQEDESDKEQEESNEPATALSGNTFPAVVDGDNVDMTVPTAEVEKAFENFAGIVNQARVVPYVVNGEPQGFQIKKIVAGSIFEKLGLSNQDIIKTVNGESLTTADQALRLFTAFRNERDIALDVERGGRNMTLSYTIE